MLPKKQKFKFIKKGMTSIFTENGKQEPCTILEMPKAHVVRRKTNDKVIVFVEYKSNVNKPLRGKFNKYDVSEKIKGFEFETYVPENSKSIDVVCFKDMKYISVQGTTKGKGFAGVMKRHNFKGGRASHGNSLAHRTPGSTGCRQDPGRVMKGKRMPGHMGNVKTTQHNLQILDIDQENSIIVVKGSVPGNKNSLVTVTEGRI